MRAAAKPETPRPRRTPDARPADVDAVYAAIRDDLPRLTEELQGLLGPRWRVAADPGQRSHPRLHLEGPADDDGRRVLAEITPVRCRASTFHATLGVSMRPGDLDLAALDRDTLDGDVATAPEPAWISRVRAFGEGAESWAAAHGSLLRVSLRPGGGTAGPAAAKLALADRFGLPRRYAKGWPERFLGVRTEPVPGERFAAFAREAAALAAAVAAVACRPR